MDCIFCKIVDGSINAKIEYQDDVMLAFNDLNPQAPIHLLVIPKMHIESLDYIDNNNSSILSHIFVQIPNIVKKFDIADGYRLVSNCGERAGQTVKHLHFHILSGRDMKWPPG